MTLLQFEDVSVGYRTATGLLPAVRHVDLAVGSGEVVGIAGESGCGKSTLGRCLTRLYDVTSGEIRFEGRDITRLGRRALRPVRTRMQMVFQDPWGTLNPRHRVRRAIEEPLLLHTPLGAAERRDRAEEAAARSASTARSSTAPPPRSRAASFSASPSPALS